MVVISYPRNLNHNIKFERSGFSKTQSKKNLKEYLSIGTNNDRKSVNDLLTEILHKKSHSFSKGEFTDI